MTLLAECPSDDWLLTLPEPTSAASTFSVFFANGQTFTDVLPALADLPYWPGTEPWAVPGVWEESPAARPGPSREVLGFQAAVAGLAGLTGAELSGRSDVQVLVDLQALLAAGEQLRVVQLGRLVDAQVRNVARLDDEVSLRTWVRRRFDDAHRDDLPLSGSIRAYPLLQAQVRTGQVGVEAAALVAAALGRVKARVDRPDGLIDDLVGDEVIAAVVGHVLEQVAGARLGLPDGHPLLLALKEQIAQILTAGGSQLDRLEAGYCLLGQHVPLGYLKACLREQTDALLPAGLEQRSLRAHDNRGLRLTPATDDRSGGRLVADLDDETYELLHTALGASARRDPANPDDTSRKADAFGEPAGEFGADVESRGDVQFPRNNRQRGHDALRLVLQRYLSCDLAGTHDKTPVSVTVTVGADLLEGRPGALPAKGGSGRSLPSSLLRQWWGDTSVAALVLTEGLIPLGITHHGRTLTAAERKASLIQHGGGCSGLRCCTPNDPLTQLIPHHVYKYSLFGRTSIVETIWACPRLHMAIHHGQTVQLRDGRWLNEDGWTDPPR